MIKIIEFNWQRFYFQHPHPMRGTNLKNEKKRTKNHIFEAERGRNEAEKSEPAKSTFRIAFKCKYQIFNFLAQFSER